MDDTKKRPVNDHIPHRLLKCGHPDTISHFIASGISEMVQRALPAIVGGVLTPSQFQDHVIKFVDYVFTETGLDNHTTPELQKYAEDAGAYADREKDENLN